MSREARWWVIGARCASGVPWAYFQGALGKTAVLHDGGGVVIQLPSRVGVFATPWTPARQASLCLTISWSLLKLMCMESAMPSNRTIDVVRLAGTRSMRACLPAPLGKFSPQIFHQMESFQGFPGGPVVKSSPSSAGAAGSVPDQGTKIAHASQP